MHVSKDADVITAARLLIKVIKFLHSHTDITPPHHNSDVVILSVAFMDDGWSANAITSATV